MINNLNRRKGYTEVLYNYRSEKFFTDAIGNQFQELDIQLGDGNNGGDAGQEKDPIFVSSPAYNISEQAISEWDDAYRWGNHAEAGYLTSVPSTEVPTLQEVTDEGNKTNNQIDIQNNGSYAITLDPTQSINTNSGVGLNIGNYGTNAWRAQIDGTTGDVAVEGEITTPSLKISSDGTDKGALTIKDEGEYSEIRFRANDGSQQSILQGVNANLYLYSGANGTISLNTYSTFDRDGNVILNTGGAGTTTIQGDIITDGSIDISNGEHIVLGRTDDRKMQLGANTSGNVILETLGLNNNGDFYIDVDTTLIRTRSGTDYATNATFEDGNCTLNGAGNAVLTTSENEIDITGDVTISGELTTGDITTGALVMKSEQLSNTTTWNSYIQNINASSGSLGIKNAVGGISIWSDNGSASSIALKVNSDISVKNVLTVDNSGAEVKGRLTVDGMTQLANVDSLPGTNNELGDVCVLTTDNKPYFYDGSSWREMNLIQVKQKYSLAYLTWLTFTVRKESAAFRISFIT